MSDDSKPLDPIPSHYSINDATDKTVITISTPEITVEGIGIEIKWIPAGDERCKTGGSCLVPVESVDQEVLDVESEIRTAIARREARRK